MDLFFMLLTTIMVPISYIWPSRIISMTYKTFGRSITIKNDKLAKVLIAEKNILGDSNIVLCSCIEHKTERSNSVS